MVHTSHQCGRGPLRDHYLSRCECTSVTSHPFFLKTSFAPFSFCSPTSSVHGERPCYGIMIGGSLRSSHSSPSELRVSSRLLCRAGGRRHRFLIASSAAAGTELGLYLHTVFKSSDRAFQEGTGVKEGDARAVVMIGPTLATNLLSTLLIGTQAW